MLRGNLVRLPVAVKSKAAPATVSGEPLFNQPLLFSGGRRTEASTRKPGDLPGDK